jgi:hypothetical protein
VSPAGFAAGQILVMSPLTAPVWILGLVHGLFSQQLRQARPAVWIFVAAFALLAASGSAQPYYLAPAYPIVLAAGGVALERMAERGRRMLGAATAALALGGVPLLPIALPLLPPETLVAYLRALRGDARTLGTDFDSELPGHLALRFGWPELTQAVARARDALAPAERSRIAVLAPSFGEAAALDFLGPALALPPAAGTHNAYGHWGPPRDAGALLLVIADEAQPRLAHQDRPPGYRRGDTPRELASLCGSVERLASVDCRYCSPYVERKAVFACRRPWRPLAEIWEDLRDTL